jgi:formylglycine-generating enzyme required for sulfatase activity
MAHIFISYAKKDTRELALKLREALTAIPGLTAWMDVSLETGESWAAQIEEEIDKADLVVVLLSPDVNRKGRRSFVLNEIDYAQQERKPIIPVMAQPARVPVQLAGIQYTSLTGDQDTALRALVSGIAQRVGVRPPSEPAAPVSPAPSRPRSLRPAITAIAGLALLGLIAAVLLLNNLAPESRVTPTTAAAVVNNPTSTDVPTTAVAAQDTATATPTHTPTIAPTPSVTATELPIELIVGTLDAQATIDQAAVNAEASAAARATEYAVGTQNVIDQTATATLWTATPTANITASIEAFRTQQAATATAQHRADLTATATLWTATPTVTPTPTATRTPSSTPTLSPEQLASTPVARNAEWSSFARDFDGVTMVLVPVGCFMMGSTEGTSDEQPVEQQCFDEPFWIDRYEVTNAQYGSTGCTDWSSEPDQPRNCVNWIDASAYCEARGARLPTEAEWEYAARGPDGLVYPWGNSYNAELVIGEDDPTYGDKTTAPVGSRAGGASWVGALDMSGNVWEWVSSIYRDYPYREDDGREDNANRTDLRVLRGGSFFNSSNSLRAASRGNRNPVVGYFFIGFRCARSS